MRGKGGELYPRHRRIEFGWACLPVATLGVILLLALLAKFGAGQSIWLQAIEAYLTAVIWITITKLVFWPQFFRWEDVTGEWVLALAFSFWTATVCWIAQSLFGGSIDPVGVSLVVSLIFLVWLPRGGNKRRENDG